MNYLSIFEEIVKVIENDYSGCEIKKNWGNAEYYRNLLKQACESDELDRKRFKEIVDDYLLDYKDNHIAFVDKKSVTTLTDIGFRVRRYEDKLYVISNTQEKNIEIGTAIIAIDNLSVKEAAEKFKRKLMDQPNERQLWERIIAKFKMITILENGKERQFNITMYPGENIKSDYKCNKLDENTILVSYNDFIDYGLSCKLIAEHRQELLASKNIIIDVRNNHGGSDSVYFELLNFIFPENYVIKEEYYNLTYMTERNYNNRMATLDEYLKQQPEDEFIKEFMNELIKNKNKGFVTLDIDKSDYVVKGTKEVKKVVVLTDRYCGSSGDSFVINAKHSPWVTQIGRPTYGVIDYSNQAEQKLEDEFSLYYPTSVNEAVNYGKWYDNVGVKPDIYIPWTPEHIYKDIDLEKAIEYLKNK